MVERGVKEAIQGANASVMLLDEVTREREGGARGVAESAEGGKCPRLGSRLAGL